MVDETRGLRKKEGVTPAERYLKTLCDGTFLSLWSFSGIYRDQGANKGLEKEICDLLVVFGNHVLIFSDKACRFPVGEDMTVAWKRWFRRGVVESAKQAWGAERWIREHPDRVFIDPGCKKRFPFPLPSPDKAVFHLIVVAHHVSEVCARHLGSSGSLMIQSKLHGVENHFTNGDPFTVGDLEPAKSFVHVLDDTSLHLLMGTLDTVSDFVAYLGRKERLLRGPVAISSPGEEELLALYLQRVDHAGMHDFGVPLERATFAFSEGTWSAFCSNPQRMAQIEANRISYSWDKLIEKFSFHAVTDTQHFPGPNPVEVTEKILRFMAAEPRTSRRGLAHTIHDMLATTPAGIRRTRVVMPSALGEPYYVFLLFPRLAYLEYDEYRKLRSNALNICFKITKLQYPDAMHIVGVATESDPDSETISEDAAYFDASSWSEEEAEEARELQKATGFLTRTTKRSVHVDEYPEPQELPTMKVGRNDRCPCGSGRKYKKCHGSPHAIGWRAKTDSAQVRRP